MKKIITKSGQEINIWDSRKEASKELAVMVDDIKYAFENGVEIDDSLYIKYKDGRTYSFNKFEEEGKFRKTNFDTVIYSNDCISVAYGKVVLRNACDYDEVYSPEEDSEEKNWYFDEKEPETTEYETVETETVEEIPQQEEPQIYDVYIEAGYEHILKDLADKFLNKEFLSEENKKISYGSIYNADGRAIINKVIEYIEKVREMFPEVTDDMLYGNGAIYYMNGNDGADFD